MTMTETRPFEQSVKEDDDDFFILRKNSKPDQSNAGKSETASQSRESSPTVVSSEKESGANGEILLNDVPPISLSQSPVNVSIPSAGTTDPATAIVAAIQTAAANPAHWNSLQNPSQGLPLVPSLFSMPAFTVSLPNRVASASTSNVNPDMKFIVLPVHQCWGCRQEFTDYKQFLEHVTKSMCLPQVETNTSNGEEQQPSSDASTSLIEQFQENPCPSSSRDTDRLKVDANSDGKVSTVELVIEDVLHNIRESIANEEIIVKEEPEIVAKEEPMDTSEVTPGVKGDANDSNNNLHNDLITFENDKMNSIDSDSPVEEDTSVSDKLNIDPSHPARLKKAVYACFKCDKEFHTNIGLIRHQSSAHGAQQFPCDKPGCSKVFKNESALSDHNKRVHGPRSFACVHCNAYFTTETYLKAHVKIHMEKKHVCKVCNHSFVNKTDLNNHMRVHTGVKPYGCKVCGKAFRHVSGYYTHVRIHTGETPYQCEFCEKRFTNASNFQTHRKIHTQDKKFKCEMCGKEFIQQSNFTRHKRTHTKERPYKCEQCGEEFSYSTCLKKHLRKDHDVKPIECDRCKRTFLNKSSYVRHRTGCQFKDIVKTEAETDSAQFL